MMWMLKTQISITIFPLSKATESSVDLSVGGDEDSKEQDLIPKEAHTLNLREILDQMSCINMDDDEEVEKDIAAALKPEEREVLTFTLKDETDILTPLPCDAQLSKSQTQLLTQYNMFLIWLYYKNDKF
jgi:hypothetical protein